MKVCDHLNLLEKDYYGLAFWESPTTKVSYACNSQKRKIGKIYLVMQVLRNSPLLGAGRSKNMD